MTNHSLITRGVEKFSENFPLYFGAFIEILNPHRRSPPFSESFLKNYRTKWFHRGRAHPKMLPLLLKASLSPLGAWSPLMFINPASRFTSRTSRKITLPRLLCRRQGTTGMKPNFPPKGSSKCSSASKGSWMSNMWKQFVHERRLP